jgi:D-alanine-D-alanine ligase
VTDPHARRAVVALVFGGVSSEHEISCLTAGGVARAIDSERFDVVGIGITPAGGWVRVPLAQVEALEVVDGVLPRVDDTLPEAVLLRGPRGGLVATRDGDRLLDRVDVDVAFALLHGPFGEDGTIQGLFEMLGLRYVGAGVAASAIGMDKDLMKRAMASAGLPVGPWHAITPRSWEQDEAGVAEAVAALGYPVFVKPARGGSSLGIARVDGPDGLAAAVTAAQAYDPKVVVERGFVGCREIELAVLQGEAGAAPRVSLPGEIVVHDSDSFYDFEAKYLPEGQVTLKLPVELPADLVDRVQALAGRTFEAMNCEGLARVDLFVTPAGAPSVNELNTMPGFTRHSVFPALWQASGLDYTALITELLELALAQRPGLR